MTKPLRRSPLVCACALAFAASITAVSAQPAGTSQDGFRYSSTIEPARPELGSLAVFDLRIEGLSAASSRVAELRLDDGLSLESESIRPIASATTRGVDFRFALRVLAAGERRIASIVIVAAEGRLELGPIVIRSASAGIASDASAAWRWVVPASALRYQAFEIRLEPVSGEPASTPVSAGLAIDFAPPAGASAEPSGPLSWTVIAFEEGQLSLPAVRLESGDRSSAASVAIAALPAGIASTRAIGAFSLSLDRIAGAAPLAGATTRARLILEGRGNIPVLILPEPVLRLDGAILPQGAWISSRADDARPEGGVYAGSASLVVEIVPPRPGLLSLSFPTMVVLDSRLGMQELRVPTLELRVGKAAPSSAAWAASADWGVGLGGPAAAWARGDKSHALAELYAALRRAPPFSREVRDARKAALFCSAELGTGMPLLDVLPPPSFFIWPAFAVALTGLSLFTASRLQGRGRDRASRRDRALSGLGSRVSLAIFLALSLAFAALALASAVERREALAVVWTEKLRTVPSGKSELSIAVIKGSTARLRGSFGTYEGVVLADGVEGWAPRDSLYFY
jgi:hypothetical protein